MATDTDRVKQNVEVGRVHDTVNTKVAQQLHTLGRHVFGNTQKRVALTINVQFMARDALITLCDPAGSGINDIPTVATIEGDRRNGLGREQVFHAVNVDRVFSGHTQGKIVVRCAAINVQGIATDHEIGHTQVDSVRVAREPKQQIVPHIDMDIKPFISSRRRTGRQ